MNRTLLTDLALAPVAGYAGTKLMEPVSSKLYELESQADREREDAVRPGMPYAIAARKATHLLGINLSSKNMERLSLLFHCALTATSPKARPPWPARTLRRSTPRTAATPVSARHWTPSGPESPALRLVGSAASPDVARRHTGGIGPRGCRHLPAVPGRVGAATSPAG